MSAGRQDLDPAARALQVVLFLAGGVLLAVGILEALRRAQKEDDR